jgi:hypothetical protein
MIEGSNLVWMTTGTDGTTMRMEDAGGSTVGSLAMTVGDWYRIGVVWNGSSCTTYFGAATGALTTASGTLTGLSSPTGWKIGTGFTYNSNWFNGRLAAFKAWGTNLTAAQVTREFDYHTPLRPANLLRFHPFVSTETTDHSGLGRTLSGGSGSTTEPGPPIPWRPTPNQLIIPWDTSTAVWYAVYDTTTGELLSTGTVLPTPIPSGQAYKEYLAGQPDLSVYEWDTTARDFVLRAGADLVDRVADLVADATLTSAWASLSGADSTAMQNRVGQMLGPYRYRYSYQEVDLS